MAIVNLLWHMHQPDYRRPEDGVAQMPWVRLHAAKGYADFAHALEHAPEPHCTVNFSGILLEQLAHLAAGNLDYYAELSLRAGEGLEPAERRFIIDNFFSANTRTMITPHKRYSKLLARRDQLKRKRELKQLEQEFSDQDLLDIAAWFNLCWIGNANSHRPEVVGLIARGRDFDRNDIRTIIDIQLQIAGGVVGQYKALAEAGVIELSFTPHHHPILPLLLDLNGNGTQVVGDVLPEFSCRQCAEWHVAKGADAYRQAFGTNAAGVWPAEGSVCDGTLDLLARHGLTWVATDQQNLPPMGKPLGHLTPYMWRENGQQLAVFFRDTRLADNIGFEYSRWNPETAGRHFAAMCAELASQSQHSDPVITIALDGENPWEGYADGGARFLGSMFSEIARSETLRCDYPSRILVDRELPEIEGVSPGSWIGGNFDVWSRHGETREAWRQVVAAHDAIGPHAEGHSITELAAAQASDYFWWYGDDFSSNEKPFFDNLFRAHLVKAYESAGIEPPAELEQSLLGGTSRKSRPEIPLIAAPTADGVRSTFYEWQGALRQGNRDGGSMARDSESGISQVLLGATKTHIWLRLKVSRELLDRLRGEACIELSCSGDGVKQDFRLACGDHKLDHWDVRCEAGDFVELAIPLDALPVAGGAELALRIRVISGDSELARFPQSGKRKYILPGPDQLLGDWAV